jgi:signal peptide peptidase-like protein 3
MDGANSQVAHWYEHAGDLVALFNPSTIVLIGQAVGVVYYAALRSLALEHEMELSKTLEDAISLDSQQALLIPIFSSMGLLLSFYFFSTISFVLAVFSIVACGFSLVFVMAPLVKWVSKLALPEALRQRIYFHLYDTPVTSAVAVTLLASVVTTVSWLVTAHWTLNNVLGMALCITYVSYIRLPNVKVCTLLLCCLFVYDIFWVFLSSRIFGANVMVAVATKQADNPLRAVANTFHLPVSDLVSGKVRESLLNNNTT